MHSVFAGVERDSLTFEQVESIALGNELKVNTGSRFYKTFYNLNIRITDSFTTVSKSNSKELIDNNYIPIHIENKTVTTFNTFKLIFNKIVKYLKKYTKLTPIHPPFSREN